MAQLRLDYAQFVARDVEIVVIGPEDAAQFAGYFAKESLPFVGLPDPTASVLKLYGQEVKLFKLGRMPAQVLIDKEAVLGTAWNGRYYVLIDQKAPILIEWNQGAIKESSFGIPRGSKDAYWGQKFLALVAEAQPQGQHAIRAALQRVVP